MYNKILLLRFSIFKFLILLNLSDQYLVASFLSFNIFSKNAKLIHNF